jgi:choice-of-anchor A domain-containing protein
VKRQSIGILGILVLAAAACGPQEQSGSVVGPSDIQSLTTQLEGDSTPPVSSTDMEPDPNPDGEHYGAVSVTITATDDAAGVESITWTMSGAQSGSGTVAGNLAYVPLINTLGTTTISYYAKDRAGNYEPTRSLEVKLVEEPPTCYEVKIGLRDYNLFVRNDYTGGTDVRGKVVAGGNITMTHFSVGAQLAQDDLSDVLVAGKNLNIQHGGIFGNAHYGASTTADGTTTFYRGALSSQSGLATRISDRADTYEGWSYLLAGYWPNAVARKESWGGLFLEGTDPKLNVFELDGSTFETTRYFSISAPATSVVLVNILGTSAKFQNFSTNFSGGIDQTGVLYNFPDATSIYSRNFGFWGTILAPNAHVDFSWGSFDGGLYAKSMTGNAEGHISPMRDFYVCGGEPPEK